MPDDEYIHDIFPPELYVPEETQHIEEEGIFEGYTDIESFVDGETVAVYKFDRIVEIRVTRTMEAPEPGDPT